MENLLSCVSCLLCEDDVFPLICLCRWRRGKRKQLCYRNPRRLQLCFRNFSVQWKERYLGFTLNHLNLTFHLTLLVACFKQVSLAESDFEACCQHGNQDMAT